MADTPVAPAEVGAWPTAPQRTDPPATFVTRADAWVSATPTRTGEMNALAENVNFNAESAYDSAAEAVVSATNARDSETSALAASNFQGAWSTLSGAFAQGHSAYHLGVIWIALVTIADVAASEPSQSNGDWAALNQFYNTERTSNIMLDTGAFGQIIQITSGTFTQTFAPASTLGGGWFVYIKNAGAGLITLDPDGAETIDGLASFVMYPGEMRLIQCNGTLFTSIVTNSFNYTFTASVNFIKPPGYRSLGGLAFGGGGGGLTGYGGGGGGCTPFEMEASRFSATETVTIAAGGATATVGGNTTLGSLVTAYGGGHGSISSTQGGGGGGILSAAPGANANPGRPIRSFAATASTVALDGDFGGGYGYDGSRTGSEAATSSVYGGGGGGSGANGGRSIWGGGGGGGGTSVYAGNGGASALDGSAPSGGGGPGATSGARGELRIWGLV